jgi:dihydrofolate reductase
MELVVTENITLDGVIEATAGWFDPAGDDESDDSDVLAVVRREMEAQDALLLGRATFESFRGYWPRQVDDRTGITAHLDSVAKYVLSTTMDDPEWENTTILRGPLEPDVRALKDEPGREIGVTGSISVVRGLMAAGLVDEYRLFVYPVVLGRGERLFAEATDVPKLRLLEARAFRSGIVLMRYRPA